MQNSNGVNWKLVGGIGCGGCALVSCLGVFGFGGVYFATMQEIQSEFDSLDLTSIEIMALPDGGSSEWDDQVKNIMLSNYDSDSSGTLDTSSEVNSIPCDVWVAMDVGMKAGGEYSTSLLSVYGFDPDLFWVGYALGFDESMRSTAWNAGSSCVSDGPSVPSIDMGSTAGTIMALSSGGSNEWDEQVKSILLSEYDRNGSGALDVTGEVSAISCDVWTAIDQGMQSGGEYSSSILAVYGFEPDLIWVGYALGFDESMRATAFRAGADCTGYF